MHKNIMTDYTNMENRAPALAAVDLLANEVKNMYQTALITP